MVTKLRSDMNSPIYSCPTIPATSHSRYSAFRVQHHDAHSDSKKLRSVKRGLLNAVRLEPCGTLISSTILAFYFFALRYCVRFYRMLCVTERQKHHCVSWSSHRLEDANAKLHRNPEISELLMSILVPEDCSHRNSLRPLKQLRSDMVGQTAYPMF